MHVTMHNSRVNDTFIASCRQQQEIMHKHHDAHNYQQLTYIGIKFYSRVLASYDFHMLDITEIIFLHQLCGHHSYDAN